MTEADIFIQLKRVFGNDNVINQWSVAKDSRDDFTRSLYCPRVDFAIKPLNNDGNTDSNNRQINNAYTQYRELLHNLTTKSDITYINENNNSNPRCFIAIEIENKTSRKHRLGSIINASALGKVGIIVGMDEKVFESLLKIRNYLKFLFEVRKSDIRIDNVIIIKMSDFLQTLR